MELGLDAEAFQVSVEALQRTQVLLQAEPSAGQAEAVVVGALDGVEPALRLTGRAAAALAVEPAQVERYLLDRRAVGLQQDREDVDVGQAALEVQELTTFCLPALAGGEAPQRTLVGAGEGCDGTGHEEQREKRH